MKLQVTKNLEMSTYSAKFELVELTEFDKELLLDKEGTTFLQTSFDIMQVEMVDDGSGGQIEKETLLLKQSPQFVLFASALPIERAWSIAQYGEKTEKIAENYVRQLSEKIKTIVTELKTDVDTYSGVEQTILTP